jgi:hypothetical protein
MGTGSDYGVAMGLIFLTVRHCIVRLHVVEADLQYPGIHKAGGGELVMLLKDLTSKAK